MPEPIDGLSSDDKNSAWMWCYICHRCYRYGDAHSVNGQMMCAYFPECDGSLVRDGWPWDRVLQIFRKVDSALPEMPERNTLYLSTLFSRPSI